MMHPILPASVRFATLAFASTLLAACGDDGSAPTAAVTTPTVAVGDTLALTASGRLVSFNRATPATLIGSIGVTGLASGETLLGIDVRPADGKLYALGSRGTVYTVEPSTGVATLKATLAATAGDDNPYTALNGTVFAVDFNPVADRLRVVTNAALNLRINVDTGATITDGVVTSGATSPTIAAVAYTNAFPGATTTQLYDIDSTGVLYLQNPPNNGTLTNPRSLGVTGAVAAFDIDPRNNTGYAAVGGGAASTLYTVSFATGLATAAGTIGGGETIRSLALQATAAPTVIGLTTDNRLVAFDPRSPNTLTATIAIAGLASGESVAGIDFRPADRQLYALTSAGRVYTVDPASGNATLKSTLVADPTDTTLPYTALSGTVFSVDFNPVADRMRVIASNGQDLRINVDTGATTTDGDINRVSVPPTVLAAAYTNAFAGATTTTLYNLEANSDTLTTQNPPNNGTLVDVGPLGLDLAGMAGFDIAGGDNGLVLAALRVGTTGPFSLYTVALTSGAATLFANTSGNAALSQIGGASGPALRDIAIRL